MDINVYLKIYVILCICEDHFAPFIPEISWRASDNDVGYTLCNGTTRTSKGMLYPSAF